MKICRRILGVLVLLLTVNPVSAQDASEYPGPFPGGYPSLNTSAGSGKMYMESYFPPPVTASPTYPSWSPDGDKIAYTSRKGKKFQISVYDLNSHKSEVIPTGQGSSEQPSWSPDGRFLVFRKRINNRFNIFIHRLGGTGIRQLTFSGKSHSPSWSPYFNN